MKNTKLKLSIGLIVKNEEIYLERCLQSLKPLLDGVLSELIIADTGSSDRTLEIAKKYTSRVYQYSWCNDFAKARNFVLEKANGEWFMQIDADEIFESVESIIRFFNSSEHMNYNDASYTIRNYLDSTGLKYSDVYVCRLFRIKPGRKYQGRIHECVPIIGPEKYFDEYVHHYGYVKSDSENRLNKKIERNLPVLLEEVKKDPRNPRLLYHLAQEYRGIGETDKAIEYCKKVFTGKKNEDYNSYCMHAYGILSAIYLETKEYEKAAEISDEYINRGFSEDPIELDIIGKHLDALIMLEDYKKADERFTLFFEMIKKYKEKIEAGETGILNSAAAMKTENQELRYYQYISILEKLGKYEDALDNLCLLSDKKNKDIKNGLGCLWLEALKETEDYHKVITYYQKTSKKGPEECRYLQEIIMNIWDREPEIGGKIAEGFDKDRADLFSEVQQILLLDYTDCDIDSQMLLKLCEKLPVAAYYQRVIAVALKNGINIQSYIDRCTYTEVQQLASAVYSRDSQLSKRLIEEFFDLDKNLSRRMLLFYITLNEELLFNSLLLPEEVKRLLKNFANIMMMYLREVINPKMLNEKDCEELPEKYCFAILTDLAFQNLAKNRTADFLSYMKRAVKIYPPMIPVIKVVTADVKKEFAEQEEAGKEFQAYAVKVKKIIFELIEKGQIKEAEAIIKEYEKVNPGDSEIAVLKSRIDM